MYFILLAVSV